MGQANEKPHDPTVPELGTELLQNIINTIVDPVFVKDQEHRWIVLNDAMCTFMARPREALIGKSDYDFFPKGQADIFWEKDALVFSSGKENINEEKFTDGKGVEHTIITKKSIFTNALGKKILVGIIRDITDQKKLEQDLSESERRLRLIFDSAAEAIYGIDLKGNCTFCNTSCLRLLGYTLPEELIGKNMHELIHHSNKDGTPYPIEECHIFRAFRSGENKHVDNEVLWRKDSTSFDVEYWSYPQRINGQIVGAVVTFIDISDRKKIQKDLDTSQKKFKVLYESAADAIMLLTPERGFISGNPATIKLFGCKDEGEFISFSPSKLSPEYQPDGTQSSVKSLEMMNIALQKGSHLFEWTHRRMDGNEFLATILLTRMELEGKIILQATVRDITEKKQSEELLLRLKNEQQIILDSVRAWIFYKDTQNRFVRVNKAFCDVMQKSKEELEDKSMFDLFPREQAEAYWKDDKEVMATGQAKLGIVESMQSPAGIRWVQTDKIPYRDEHGTIIGVIGFTIDITELHRTRERLEQEAQNSRKFLQAVESSSIATVITTTEPELIYANPAWEKLTGYTEEEAMGQNPRILQSGRTPKEMYPRMWQTILNNQEFSTDEIINRRKDGTEYNAELRIYPIAENENVQYFVGMQTDITLRKRSDQAKTEFMSLASHQLRTPLTGLRWGLKMLEKKGAISIEQESLVRDLQAATARMAESINVMLQISRIESGKVEPHWKEFKLCEILQELKKTLDVQITQGELTLHTECDHDLKLTSDMALLQEVIGNLISNAVKYTPKGGTVALASKCIGDTIRITVRDTGYGIPADQQSKIFSKFFRATNVASRIPDGTGLGLYLVYSLVGLLGGTISFVSAENEGSTFTLSLPLSPSLTPPSPTPSHG